MVDKMKVDTRGIPSHICVSCGGDTFKVLARFHNYELAWYATSAYCFNCEAPVTVPTPLDREGDVA
jgi:hypothetical protein